MDYCKTEGTLGKQMKRSCKKKFARYMLIEKNLVNVTFPRKCNFSETEPVLQIRDNWSTKETRLQFYCLRAENTNTAISHPCTTEHVTCSVSCTLWFDLHNFS